MKKGLVALMMVMVLGTCLSFCTKNETKTRNIGVTVCYGHSMPANSYLQLSMPVPKMKDMWDTINDIPLDTDGCATIDQQEIDERISSICIDATHGPIAENNWFANNRHPISITVNGKNYPISKFTPSYGYIVKLH